MACDVSNEQFSALHTEKVIRLSKLAVLEVTTFAVLLFFHLVVT
jgi:hypothetical protein